MIRPIRTWRLKTKLLELGVRTRLMGVVNVTPDSFSDGGKYSDPAAAIERVFELPSLGADIVDIGAESTRPGAAPVSAKEELNRLTPVLQGVLGKVSVPISVDTYKSEVAAEVLAAGVEIINDVSGLTFDPRLAEVVARQSAAVVLVHTRGRPDVMQKLPPAPDIWREILSSLERSVHSATRAGVLEEQIVIDPGIGFGKTAEQNLEVLAQLSRLQVLALPIMAGTSRKSFLGAILDRPVEARIFGTAASVALSIAHGAHIVRVHDVEEIAGVCRVADAIENACQQPGNAEVPYFM